jgi:hypothetical protein
MKIGRFLVLGILCGFLMLPVAAMADSITPKLVVATIDVGETITIEKTVTITTKPPDTAKVDVFFLTDSTGSMVGAINAVKTSASSILSDASLLGDVAFGVGEYRDIGDAFVYQLNQDMTTDTTEALTAISTWGASGGGDAYEAQLYALEQVATETSWREDSTRILVWFGDYPGHDPSLEGATEASATAALLSENIVVQAIDLYALDGLGQATRIADATDGGYYDGIDSSSIVGTISDSIVATFAEYSEVTLQVNDGSGIVNVAVSPSSGYTGVYDRSIVRTFSFDVDIEGASPGVANFTIDALVDGGLVATETDSITTSVPDASVMLLLGPALIGLGVIRRKKN